MIRGSGRRHGEGECDGDEGLLKVKVVMVSRHGEGDGDETGDLWMGGGQEVWSKRVSAQMKVCEVGAISEG